LKKNGCSEKQQFENKEVQHLYLRHRWLENCASLLAIVGLVLTIISYEQDVDLGFIKAAIDDST